MSTPLRDGRPPRVRRSLVLPLLVAAVVAVAVVAVLLARDGGSGSTGATGSTPTGSAPTGSAPTGSAPTASASTASAPSAPAPSSPPAQGDDSAAPPPPAEGAAPLPSGRRVVCPPATVTVTGAQELAAALAQAVPGASIHLADGVYAGTFRARTSGTPDLPIFLCGGPGAVIDGQDVRHGYGLHLDPAQYWRVVGFTVRNAQKGVVADATRGTVIQDLVVEDIGDEGVHLRSASTGSAVLGTTVRRTGLRRDKFGEGIYVGSAHSNWPAGVPDRSDHNLVQGNRISDTTAESVDIKEGTTGGALIDNTFDGSATTAADSWVDVKGNGWLIADNTGTHTGKDGFQTHQVVDGWGLGNTFRGNVAATRGSGVDIYVQPGGTDNRVLCDNRDGSRGPASTNGTCQT